MQRFEDRVHIVTGGGSGIGAATVGQLLSEGACVAVVDLDHSGAEATLDRFAAGDKGMAIGGDVSDEAQVDALVARVVQVFGRLDGLVNSAGVRGVGSILDTDRATWDRNMAINLEGSFNTSQAFCNHAKTAGTPGAIVNISSQGGLEAVPNRLAYVTAKHGIIGLTRATAIEMAAYGVRANAVAPGMIRTPMTAPMFQDPVNVAKIRKAHPVGREGQPEEVAAAICFLLSDEASFITGVALPVDGGMTAGAASF